MMGSRAALLLLGWLGPLALLGCPIPAQVEPVEPSEPVGPSEPDEPDAPADPVAPAEPDEPADPDAPDELVELEYADEPLRADLDGDGELEGIAWDCQDPMTITVGASRLERVLGQSEVIECGAVIVDLPPGRLLLYTSWEHQEVGPPTHILYRRVDAELTELWSGVGELEWRTDGTWAITRSTCFDTGWETEHTTCRWDGVQVVSETHVEVEPNDSGCAEP